jgi:hypothetical protein
MRRGGMSEAARTREQALDGLPAFPFAPHYREDASHFLQEDHGPLIGQLVADWLTAG